MEQSEAGVNLDIPVSDEVVHLDHIQETEAVGFTFTREDGTVEHARTREEVLAVCPVMGKLAIDAPEKADLLLDMAALGSQQLADEVQSAKTDKLTRENNETSDLFTQNTKSPETQLDDKPQVIKSVEEVSVISPTMPQDQVEYGQIVEQAMDATSEIVETREDATKTPDHVTNTRFEAASKGEPGIEADSSVIASESNDATVASKKIHREVSNVPLSEPIHLENNTDKTNRVELDQAEENKTFSTPAEKADESIVIAPEPRPTPAEVVTPVSGEPVKAVIDYLDTAEKAQHKKVDLTHIDEPPLPIVTDDMIEVRNDATDEPVCLPDETDSSEQSIEHDEALFIDDVESVDYDYDEREQQYAGLTEDGMEYSPVEVYADLASIIAAQEEREPEVPAELTYVCGDEQAPVIQEASQKPVADNAFAEYVEEVYTEVEETITIEELYEVADEQPLEDTLVCLAKIIENTNEEDVVPESLAQVLDDIDELLQEHYSVTDEEQDATKQRAQPELTLELTEKLLQLFQELGYSQPDEALRELVRRFGYNFLLEAFEHMYKLRHDDQRKEFLPNVPSVVTPGTQVSPLRQRVGKLIFAVIARSLPQGATS